MRAFIFPVQGSQAVGMGAVLADASRAARDVFDEVDRMPRFPLAPGQTEDDLLRAEVDKYAPHRFPDGMTQEYRDRVELELRVISKMGFPGYFLVVADLCRHARENGIRVGPGRGSAAGAVIAYALGITEHTAKDHLKSILAKLRAADRTQAVTLALQRGIIRL